MKINQALKIRDSAIVSLRDVYSSAKLCGYTSALLNEAYSQILGRLPANAPRWVRSYLDGYRQCLSDMLYETSLVYGGYIGGEFHSTHRSRADYYEAKGVSACEFATSGKVERLGHYWSHDTRKPFFISEEH